MAKLPEVHICHLLIRDSGLPKQGGKGFCPFRFFARYFGESGGLNQPRRERRIQHVGLNPAARARKRGEDTSFSADAFPVSVVVNRIDHGDDARAPVGFQLAERLNQLVFPNGQKDEIVVVAVLQFG